MADLPEDLFAGTAYAGFRNIELNDCFFTMALRDKVIALTRSNRKRSDPEHFFPAKVRITMIQVSAGSTYDPSLLPPR